MRKSRYPKGITADALLRRRLGDTKWIVPEILPSGLSILAGPPKVSKSWMLWNIAAGVASGTPVLDKLPTKQGAVAYLALEDNIRRAKTRLSKTLGDREAPTDLHVFLEWPRLHEGAVGLLEQWLDDHSGARLIIIDTLVRISGIHRPKGDAYHADYAVMENLKRLADKRSVALLVCHHTRKTPHADPFLQFSGSIGLIGAADTLLYLSRPRGGDVARLQVSGRDTEEQDLKLRFIPKLGRFELISDVTDVPLSPHRREVLAFVQSADRPVGPKAVAEALNMRYGSVHRSMREMAEKHRLLSRVGRGYVPIDPLVTTATNVTADSTASSRIPSNVIVFPSIPEDDGVQ